MERTNEVSSAAELRADVELWRRVPWVVLLAACGQDQIPTVTFGAGSDAIDVHVGGTCLDHALIGRWYLPWSLPRQSSFVDCRTGQLMVVHNEHLTGRAVPLAASDIEFDRIAPAVGPLLDPRPLLAIEPAMLEIAVWSFVQACILNFRVTPRWCHANEELDGDDATLFALASSWSGSVSALMEASGLVTAR